MLFSSDLSVTDSGVLETGTEGEDSEGLVGLQSTDSANHNVWADVAVSE